MKRLLAVGLCAALIVAAAPPAAWAQFSEAASARAVAAPLPAASAGAAALGGAPRAITLGAVSLSAPSLAASPAALSAFTPAPGRPFELAPRAITVEARVAPAVPVAAKTSDAADGVATPTGGASATVAAVVPAGTRVETAAFVQKISAPETARVPGIAGLFGVPAARALPVGLAAAELEKLFAGAPERVALADDVPVLNFESAPNLARSSPRAGFQQLHVGIEPYNAVRNIAPGAAPGEAETFAVPPGKVSAPAAAAAKSAGGFLRRGWEKLKGLYRVLPDEARNRQFWYFTIGQAFVTLGFNFNYTALPGLLASNKQDTTKLSTNRAVNWGSQAASSLMTGPLVDRQPIKRTVVWTYLGRGALMTLVPVLFATGHFGFGVFCALIGMAGFLQSTGVTAMSVAFNRILGEDEAYYNRANAISTIVTDAVGVVAPLAAGAFIAWAAKFFATALMGNALAFGVYGVLLLMTGVGYGIFLKLPRDESLEARRGLQQSLKSVDIGGGKVKGVSVGAVEGKPALLVEIGGADPAQTKGLPAEYKGYVVKAVPARNAVKELIQGFRIAFADRFLRLYLLTTTVAVASGDALTFAALTRYLNDVLHAGAGAFGVFLAASSLGLALSSILMTFAKDPAQAALAPAAREFRAALTARDAALDAAHLDHAAAALRGSLKPVLERYEADWRAHAERARTTDALASDVLAEAARAVGGALQLEPAAAAALLESTSAARDVRLWAARRGQRLLDSTRKDAKTGMDSLQRQGRWTAYLAAASWLVYAGMFFTGSRNLSVALMLVSSALAGGQSIVWSSLSTRVIQGSYAQDQGKVYSAMSFYMLACSVVGVLAIGWMLAALATSTALLVTAGILAACAVFSVLQGWKSFPLARR